MLGPKAITKSKVGSVWGRGWWRYLKAWCLLGSLGLKCTLSEPPGKPKLYIMPYLKWMANKDLLYSTGNSTQCYVTDWMGSEFGEDGYMYIHG